MLAGIDERGLVIDPEHLDPILNAYENANCSLKVENSVLRNDLGNLTDTVDLLLKDNQKLREYMEKKNADIEGVLETVSENEGELVMALKSNLEVLTEENKQLSYEISMLRDLRLKDKQRQEIADEKLIEQKRLLARVEEDLNEGRLRNQSLENQTRILNDRISSLVTELEQEQLRRERLDKQLNQMKTQAADSNPRAVWDSKVKAIKDYDEIIKTNSLLTQENHAHQLVIAQLKEQLARKEEEIERHLTAIRDLEREVDTGKADFISMQVNYEAMKKKLDHLMEEAGENVGSFPLSDADFRRGSQLNSPELKLLHEETLRLRGVLQDRERMYKLELDQVARMSEDYTSSLLKENSDLKGEKRNLLNKVRALMDRSAQPDPLPSIEINTISEPTAEAISLRRENQALRQMNGDLEKNNKELHDRVLLLASKPKEVLIDPQDFSIERHHIGLQPSHKRASLADHRRHLDRSRELSPIETIVEQINAKDMKTPAPLNATAIERIFEHGSREHSPNLINPLIDRRKKSSMAPPAMRETLPLSQNPPHRPAAAPVPAALGRNPPTANQRPPQAQPKPLAAQPPQIVQLAPQHPANTQPQPIASLLQGMLPALDNSASSGLKNDTSSLSQGLSGFFTSNNQPNNQPNKSGLLEGFRLKK